MQKIIGLDIGSYSVKAVEIINHLSTYQISRFYENIIPQIDEVSPDVIIPVCMEQLFRENNIEADRIITAMPGQYISSRVLQFDFSDSKKIEMAIPAEIEDLVPFNLDDMIIDHQVLGTVGKQTAALVVMTRKTFLGSFLDHLQRINIDPKLVDVDSLSFYNLCPFLDMQPNLCYGIVDIGHEKTSVCLVQDGVLKMFRSVNLGGRYLTEFLARDLEVSYSEAQRQKHLVSRVLCDKDQGSELSGDEKAVATRLTLATSAIVKELGRTLYAFKTWEKTPITKIYLSGGTAKIRNLDAYLSDHLELPVTSMRLGESNLQLNPDLEKSMMIMPQSVAIGLRAVSAVKRHSQINLRRGDFAYVQDYESILRGAALGFKVVGLALMLLLISYGARFYFYGKQTEALQDKFQKEYFATFPDAKSKYKQGQIAFQKLRTDAKTSLLDKTRVMEDAIRGFVEVNSDSGSLVSLKAVSDALPKDIKVDITLFEFTGANDGSGRLVIRGETDAYKSVETVLESLRTVKILSNVQEKSSGAKPGTDNKIIEFTINATYGNKPKDDGKAT